MYSNLYYNRGRWYALVDGPSHVPHWRFSRNQVGTGEEGGGAGVKGNQMGTGEEGGGVKGNQVGSGEGGRASL